MKLFLLFFCGAICYAAPQPAELTRLKDILKKGLESRSKVLQQKKSDVGAAYSKSVLVHLKVHNLKSISS